MSQQRIFVAVCVLGAVVLASAQSWDMDTCQKALGSEMEQYANSLRAAGQKFASSMQQNAESMADTSQFDADIDKMINSVMGLMQQGTNFDAGRLSNVYMENLQTMSNMMRTAFRMYMKMPQGAMTSYMELGQSVMSAQSRLMQSVSSKCMPGAKSSVTPQ